MAQIGSKTYAATTDDALKLVKKFADQSIEALKGTNPLEAVFNTKVIENGNDIEDAIVKAAEAQIYDPTGANLWTKHVPEIMAEYFNEWDEKQFWATIQRDDIRKITLKSKSAEDVAVQLIDTVKQGESNYDFKEDRKALTKPGFYVDYTTICKRKPTTLTGCLTLIRDAYNHLKNLNADATHNEHGFEQRTAPDDIYIIVPTKLSELFETRVYSELYNPKNTAILGKMIDLDVDDLPETEWYKVKIIDRKVLKKYRRIYEIKKAENIAGRFEQYVMTTDYMRGLCGLFKAVELDCTDPAKKELDAISTSTVAKG